MRVAAAQTLQHAHLDADQIGVEHAEQLASSHRPDW